MIDLTPSAIEAAGNLKLNNTDYSNLDLRVYLSGKGCDGFDYGVAFDERAPGDLIFPHGEICLVCDKDSYQFLEGSTIDWVDDDRGQGFLVENPNHQKFRGKFYKRKSWRKRLLGEDQPST